MAAGQVLKDEIVDRSVKPIPKFGEQLVQDKGKEDANQEHIPTNTDRTVTSSSESEASFVD